MPKVSEVLVLKHRILELGDEVRRLRDELGDTTWLWRKEAEFRAEVLSHTVIKDEAISPDGRGGARRGAGARPWWVDAALDRRAELEF